MTLRLRNVLACERDRYDSTSDEVYKTNPHYALEFAQSCGDCLQALEDVIAARPAEPQLPPYDQEKFVALLKRVEARYESEDLDEYVHEAASLPASDTNNGGIEDQLDMLVSAYGLEYTARLLFPHDGTD